MSRLVVLRQFAVRVLLQRLYPILGILLNYLRQNVRGTNLQGRGLLGSFA
jgi:hypothetical protein